MSTSRPLVVAVLAAVAALGAHGAIALSRHAPLEPRTAELLRRIDALAARVAELEGTGTPTLQRAAATTAPVPLPANQQSLVLDLVRRVGALEKGRNRVTAPFDVVDRAGQPILRVGQFAGGRGLVVMAPGESATATLFTAGEKVGLQLSGGGAETFLTADAFSMTRDGAQSQMSVEGTSFDDGKGGAIELSSRFGMTIKGGGGDSAALAASGLVLSEDGGTVAELYSPPGKAVALRIMKGGKVLAAVGVNEFGAGALKVTNPAGKVVASVQGRDGGAGAVDVFGTSSDYSAAGLGVDGRGGYVGVRDKAGEIAAAMSLSSDAKGGNLTLSNAGFGVFSAGAASDGGGEACLNRVTGGGKQRNVCLGVELPSMGLGK